MNWLAATLKNRRVWTGSVAVALVSRQVLQLAWSVLQNLRLVDVTGELEDERHDGGQI